MTYYIKRCAQCAAENHPAEVVCRHCGVMLPAAKAPSATEPPAPSQEAIEAIRRGGVHGIAPDSIQEPAPEPIAPSEPPTPTLALPDKLRITIVGVDIPFMDLLWLSTNIILAALPALVLATIIVVSIIMGLGIVFGILQAMF